MNRTNKSYPLVVSFFAGDDYYYKASEQLHKDCEILGLDSHIVEANIDKNAPWFDICRYKVKFIKECLNDSSRPIMWIDVDCRILQLPTVLKNSQVDFAAFLRSFQYLQNFDPLAYPRQFHPSILYFGQSSITKDFVDCMCTIEANHEATATDDYFLQEAWEQFDQNMSILLLPPSMLTQELPAHGNEVFYFGRSGSVSKFKNKCVQHEPALYQPQRRLSILQKEAQDSLNVGNLEDAIFLLKRALKYSNNDEKLAYRIARLIRKNGDLDAGFRFLQDFQLRNKSIEDHSHRFLLDANLISNNLEEAEAIAHQLIREGSIEDRSWAQSRLIRIEMSQRAKLNNFNTSERTKLWWMQGPYPGNFGDMLNPYVIEKLTGIPPKFSSYKSALIAIGSTIKFAGASSQVWGAGTPRMTDKLCPQTKYHAVRGPLTRQLVLESGGDCPEVYGDPAFFLPKVYQPKPSKEKYKMGLVRHYTNANDLVLSEDVKDISVIRVGYDGIEEFIDEINQCEKILSTSLHGLIVSHAYGIPAQWCIVVDSENPIPGDGTKYHDYMMSVGITPTRPIQLTRDTVIDIKYANGIAQLPEKNIDLRALAESAPFEVIIDV